MGRSVAAAGSGPGRRRLRFTVRIVVSVGLVAALVQILGADNVGEALSAVRAGPWLGAMGAFLLLHLLSAAKWRLFLRLSGSELRFGSAVRCHFGGLFANLFLPSLIGGDIVRAGMAFGRARSKEGVVLGSLVDRLSDVGGLAFLAAGGWLVAPGATAAGAERGVQISPGVVIVTALAGVAAAVATGVIAGRLVVRSRAPRRLRRVVLRLVRAGRTLRARPGGAVAGFLLGTVIQGTFVVVNERLGRSLGLAMDLRLWFLLWPLAKIAAMLPLSLGGIGVREVAFAVLVAPFGIRPELAVAQSLVWQTVLMSGGVLGGLLWLVHGLRSSRRAPEGTA